MPTKPVFGGYAFSVINDPSGVTGFEVRGVAPDGVTCAVTVSDTPEWFSVYARMRTGEAMCVGDFPTREEADEYASESTEAFWRAKQKVPLL